MSHPHLRIQLSLEIKHTNTQTGVTISSLTSLGCSIMRVNNLIITGWQEAMARSLNPFRVILRGQDYCYTEMDRRYEYSTLNFLVYSCIHDFLDGSS